MPLRRLLVAPAQLASAREGRLALLPEQARHLLSVLRLAAGDALELFDGQGGRFPAQLAPDSTGGLELLLLETSASEPGSRASGAAAAAKLGEPGDLLAGPLDVALAQALVKADKLELVIQKATELGCARIIPFAAERSIVKLAGDERGQAKALRWRKIAEEAARQCGRADVPQLDLPAGWDALFALLASDPPRRAIALDPRASLRLGAAALGASRLLLAVGPEGGFSPEELARAEQHGFLRASLGPLVLRTETAGLAALAVVQHLAGALG